MMTREDLAKLLMQEENINVKTLMRQCAEEHEQREALSKIRQVWQRSRVGTKLRNGGRNKTGTAPAAAL